MSKFIYLLLLVIFAFSRSALAEDMNCKIALEALNAASKIRGLKIKKTVPCVVQNKKEIEEYLLKIIAEQLPVSRLKYEELVYKKLGILPQDFDYKKGIVDLYLSQIGGYYDPEKDHFVMAGWLPGSMQKGIAAHELTHALQDQYYDLKKFIDPLTQSGDVVLAHSALVEGDATAVMYDYERKNLNQPPLKNQSNINDLLLGNLAGSAALAGNVPKSLQMILLFPYTGGFNFVHNILKNNGYAGLLEVYQRPPQTTEEIIHIEKYYENKKDYIVFTDQQIKEPDMNDYEILYQDVVGEFGIVALLNMFELSQSEIRNAAMGWGGDKIALLFDKKIDKKMLVWKINWDTQKDLEEFKQVFDKALQNRFTESKISNEQGSYILSLKTQID